MVVIFPHGGDWALRAAHRKEARTSSLVLPGTPRNPSSGPELHNCTAALSEVRGPAGGGDTPTADCSAGREERVK